MGNETYNDYYDRPAAWFRWRYDTQVKRKTCLDLLHRHVRDLHGRRVFELGFGSAETLFSLPRNCEIAGVELSESAVRRAAGKARQQERNNCRFEMIAEGATLPFGDGEFDIAIASHVLEHVPDATSTLRELRRLLRPGGLLLLVVPINEKYPDENHRRTYTSGSLRADCERNGFRFREGIENEVLYHLVEDLYQRCDAGGWSLVDNVVRVAFNLSTARLPFWAYRVADRVLEQISGLPARQAAMVLERRD